MLTRKQSLAAASTLLLMGCTPTAKIQSTTRRGYTKTLDRVYVLASTSASGSTKFLKDLQSSLTQKLSQAGIANKVHVYDNLNLDEKGVIKKEVQELGPHFFLEISQSSTTLGQGGAYGASFDLALTEAGEEAMVWKAELNTSGGMAPTGSAPGEGSAEQTAQEIVNKLTQDGLIRSAPGPQQ